MKKLERIVLTGYLDRDLIQKWQGYLKEVIWKHESQGLFFGGISQLRESNSIARFLCKIIASEIEQGMFFFQISS